MSAVITAVRGLLKGRKTYLTVIMGILVIIANARGIEVPGVDLDPNNWLSDILVALGAATMRAGIGNSK